MSVSAAENKGFRLVAPSFCTSSFLMHFLLFVFFMLNFKKPIKSEVFYYIVPIIRYSESKNCQSNRTGQVL